MSGWNKKIRQPAPNKFDQEKNMAEGWHGGPRFGPTAAQMEEEARWNPNYDNIKAERDLRSEIYETRRHLSLLEMKYEDKYGKLG